MQEVLISGKTSFKIEVPYKLIETGEKTDQGKPLILYLHGFNQNLDILTSHIQPLLELNAYHLLIQGPYPIYDRSRKKNVSEWGRSWYLYDGNQGQFIKSMEVASEFIQEIIDDLNKVIRISRLCVIGYSMGGYLGGYFALSRWKYTNDLIAIGARIKTEAFEGKLEPAKHIRICAIHGKNDESVFPEPQQKEIEKLKNLGFDAQFKPVNESHELSEAYIIECRKWLESKGYT